MKNKLDCLKLINFIEKSSDFKKYILPCQNILIAYSGGQDSSALLAIFYILSKKWHFNIGVVYCNHNWTNSPQASIAAFELIHNLNLPFYFVDSNRAIKPENQARDWRYNSFAAILNNSHYDLLLTGHTLSDCAETILFNLCRGSGLKGVCSLKKFQVFKPLLSVSQNLGKKQKSQNIKFKPTQFQMHIFSLNDLKDSHNKNVFPAASLKLSWPRFTKVSSSKPGKYLFACYLKQKQKQMTSTQSLIKVNQTQKAPRKAFFASFAFVFTKFGSKISESTKTKRTKTKEFKMIKKDQPSVFRQIMLEKSVQFELFHITFFDPIVHVFIQNPSSSSIPVSFSPVFICSLFSNLRFYQTSNLKLEINDVWAEKFHHTSFNFSKIKGVCSCHSYISSPFICFCKYQSSEAKVSCKSTKDKKGRFSMINFKSELDRVIFFIQLGLKNKKTMISFPGLLDKKLKEKIIQTKPLIYFLRPSLICSTFSKLYFASYSYSGNSFCFCSASIDSNRKVQVSNPKATGCFWITKSSKSKKRNCFFFKDQNLQFLNFDSAKNNLEIKHEKSFDLQQKNLCEKKEQLVIYRPLIGIHREIISFFDQQLNLIIIPDKSNNNLNLTRNFIRHKILPLLKLINPQVEQNLYKFSQIAALYLQHIGHLELDLKRVDIFKP